MNETAADADGSGQHSSLLWIYFLFPTSPESSLLFLRISWFWGQVCFIHTATWGHECLYLADRTNLLEPELRLRFWWSNCSLSQWHATNSLALTLCVFFLFYNFGWHFLSLCIETKLLAVQAGGQHPWLFKIDKNLEYCQIIQMLLKKNQHF